MSRHQLSPNETIRSGCRIVVGWDHPLLTYFVQVYDTDKEKSDPDNAIIFWKGGKPKELYELDDLRQALRGYGVISHPVSVKLYGDRDDGK